ncbi:MAG: HAD-IIIA family hydrolase, partial [Aeromonas sobria]
MSKAAIFLDRDGVINEDTGYVSQVDDFHFLPGVIEALQLLKKKGYLLIVVTNQ